MNNKYLKKQLLIKTRDGLSIFLVDGEYVRNTLNCDFCIAGHAFRYDFIPNKEIWVERLDTNYMDTIFDIIHEIVERAIMACSDLSYNLAHERALHIEETARHLYSKHIYND